jgi:hypothetical protein
MDGYVSKPIKLQELIGVIENCTHREPRTDQEGKFV